MEQYILSLDIGGTKTSGALFDTSGSLIGDYVYTAASKTYEGEEAVYQNTRGVLAAVLDKLQVSIDNVKAIGVGSPGPLDVKRGVIIHAPMMGWHNFPIVSRLEEDFHIPVFLDNDGNLGALAEQRVGVAQGIANMMYMTVSTGCGGGVIVNGEIYRGFGDYAGEVGHMCVELTGEPCPCKAQGCFEQYASGTALNRMARRDMDSGVHSLAFDLARRGNEQVSGKHLFIAAEQGDEYAISLYCREGYYLGVGLSNLFNLFSPEVIVLGGGVTKAKRFFHGTLMEELNRRCLQKIDETRVRYSVMNDRVVLYGAWCMANEKITVLQ